MTNTEDTKAGQFSSITAVTAVLRLLLACTLWLWAVPVLVVTLVLDLLAWPWVARGRTRSDDDTAPRGRDAAILILNWNGADYLRALLPSVERALAEAPGDHEVLVVDNGSTDDSVAIVERDFPWARVVRLPENRFFIGGNRAGVEAVSPGKDLLVFLNNDMVVEPAFFRELLAPFGPTDLFATTARIELDGGSTAETGRTRFFYKRGALRQEQIPFEGDVGAEPAQWAGGGSSAFDRAKFEALGGFEELYAPCYMEDASLSYAAWKRGWRVELAPGARVRHVHRGTSRRVFGDREVERLDRRNRELFFWRSVTDVGWVVSHAFHMPWNAFKDARRTGMWLQIEAIVAATPRLPAAWVARQRARRGERRRDRDAVVSGR